MKVALISVFGILVIALAILGVMGSKIQEIETEIEISAPPEKVWEALMDIDAWHTWSPIINSSSGAATIGSTLQMTMAGKAPGTDGPSYSPKIVELNKPFLFRWRAHMMAGFIMTNDKIFELEATPAGTRLIHKELFKGLLAPIFCSKMEEGVPPMLNSMNQALKELVEK
ncbi:MAG: SRPBCC domain-containing protein [Bdellovibrionales bacterium]|nr:SRPBCC domain-containing protein [Bdellovibrionales bacterium]